MVWEKKTADPTRPHGTLPEVAGNDIDIRAEFKAIINDHGHTVFLRQSTGQVCACRKRQDNLTHPDPFDEFDRSCPGCQGFGYHYRDRRIRAYRRPAFGTFGLTGAVRRTPVGGVNAGDLVWYFEYGEQVRIGNHIVEVTDNDLGEPVVAINIERIHEIKQPHITRDRKGRTEFWEVLTREVVLGK